MEWFEAVPKVRPYVVKISTPSGWGTGFLFVRSEKDSAICGIATAAHVVDDAHNWEMPIRMTQQETNTTQFIKPTERAIFLNSAKDVATIVFRANGLTLPEKTLPLIDPAKAVKVGAQIGWLGFPSVAPNTLCFFNGPVSAWDSKEECYLVDGVAINGVSGGPALYVRIVEKGPDELTLMGVVSAYIHNRGNVPLGLLQVQDIAETQATIKMLKDVDQAQSQQTPPAADPSTPPATPSADNKTA